MKIIKNSFIINDEVEGKKLLINNNNNSNVIYLVLGSAFSI
jgi:hypothetical protein